MSRTIPYLEGERLFFPKDGTFITVETPAWYAWLEQHSSFAFTGDSGRSTIRKERGGSSCAYWKAYRRSAGKLFSVYVARSSDLTLDRLQIAVQSLIVALVSASITPELPPAEAAPLARAALSDTLLRTKFFVPPVRRQRVARTRLLDRLRDDTQPLVLIAAPAGFGKTTLITDWIATDQRTAIWLALDEGDNDILHFWMAVALAFDALRPGVCARALQLLRSPQPSLDDAFPILINELSVAFNDDPQDLPALLVLDDYHVIEDRFIHETVALLLDRLPARLRLVIASRRDVPLPLSRLRVRDQLAELHTADLAFTSGEVAAFLGETMGLSLTDDLIAALFRRTEGWIASLQLAALSLRDQADPAALVSAFSGSHRHVLAYLIDEVFSRQPAAIQTFLLHTCMLERMCAPLCDAVLGIEQAAAVGENQRGSPRKAQALLDELERSNLFTVALDNQQHWYRYHQLFAEMLLQRLRSTTPALEATLRRRASDWYAQAGYMPEAITQALAGQDWPQAARLIEQIADALWRRSEFGVLEGWLNTLPEIYVHARPRLGLARAMVLCAKKEFDTVSVLLDTVARGLMNWDASLDTGLYAALPPVAVLWARLTAIRANVARVRGDLAQARVLGQQALDGLPANDDWRAVVTIDLAAVAYISEDLETARRLHGLITALAQKSGNHYLFLFGVSRQASCLIDFSSLKEAHALLDQTRRLATTLDVLDLPAISYVDSAHAFIRYEQNDLAGAEDALRHAIDVAWPGRLTEIRAFCYCYLARIYLAHGSLAEALWAVDQGDAIFRQTTSFGQSSIPWRRMFVSAWRAKIHAAQGNIAAVARWADDMATEVDPASVPLTSHYYRPILLMQARARLLQGQPTAALKLLDSWQARVAKTGYNDALIEIQVLRALALEQSRRSAEAREALAQALSLAAPEGYVRMFVDEGAPMADLLSAAYKRGIERPYVARLLAAFPALGSQALSVGGQSQRAESVEALYEIPDVLSSVLVESLNVRELEILRLLAVGRSNHEIAKQLGLAMSTVKWYLQEMYDKLHVTSRTQALVRAGALGLLS